MYEHMNICPPACIASLGAHLNAQLKNATASAPHSKARHNHRDVTCFQINKYMCQPTHKPQL